MSRDQYLHVDPYGARALSIAENPDSFTGSSGVPHRYTSAAIGTDCAASTQPAAFIA